MGPLKPRDQIAGQRKKEIKDKNHTAPVTNRKISKNTNKKVKNIKAIDHLKEIKATIKCTF